MTKIPPGEYIIRGQLHSKNVQHLFWALAKEERIKIEVEETPLTPAKYEKQTALKILGLLQYDKTGELICPIPGDYDRI